MEQIVNFLGIYKQYTCLWDASSEYYLERDKRQAAIQTLSLILEIKDMEILMLGI